MSGVWSADASTANGALTSSVPDFRGGELFQFGSHESSRISAPTIAGVETEETTEEEEEEEMKEEAEVDEGVDEEE